MRTSQLQFRPPSLRVLLPLLAMALSVVSTTYATDTIWTNTGIINVPPRIDAISVVNSGLMNIFTDLPFETSNTQNFTNSGTIEARPGWFFNNAPTTIGDRGLMANFVNQSGGLIEALDAPQTLFIIGLPGGATFPSYLWVSATNIVNRGTITVGAGGWLKLAGTNVNLARGGVEVASIVGVGSDNVGTNYFPEAGISDIYWAATNIASPPGVPTAGIWNGSVARAPVHDITVGGGGIPFQQPFSFAMTAAFADSYSATNGFILVTVTNLIGLTNLPSGPTVSNIQVTNIVVETILVPTNITHQAVFVGSSDPTLLSANIYFHNSSSFTNLYKTAEVEMIFVSPNNVSGTTEANTIYVYDTLASEIGRGVLANVSSAQNQTTYRPTNYIVSRLQLGKFGFGFTGNGYPDPDYLWAPSYSNSVVAGDYSAYGAYVANIPAIPPINPAGTYTNLSGRVQIYADSLDLTRTRLRGQGEVTINTRHLVGSSNAVVDCPNLAFNLASTNNNLVFANLANTSVQRLEGDLYLYSLVWQNQQTFYSDSWIITTNLDTNGVISSLDATFTPLTNGCDLNLMASLVNGVNLATSLPVYVWDLKLLNPNVTVSDNMSVVNTFFCDASAFTLNGSINFTDGAWRTTLGYVTFAGLQDFVSTNIPHLLNFTNNGSFSVPSTAHFGDDRPTPLDNFVNAGSIRSYSINVSSTYFRNSGNLSGAGPLSITAAEADLTGGSSAARNTFISSDSLRMNGYRLTANGPLTFEVASLFTDAGTAGSTNFISLFNGIMVATKPTSGDILVTGIRSSLRGFSQTDHIWPGEDRGVSADGYTNNLAVGRFSFAGAVTQGPPLAWFEGTGDQNALYVDLLDLTALGTNYANVLGIDSNFTIYYSAAKLSFTPPNAPNGVPQTPEEYLNGQFNGRLRWVSSYAGIYSSVAVVLDGQTVLMNAALRNSRLTDSDGDGVPNFYDTTPLGGTIETPPGGSVVLSPGFVNPGAGNKTFGISWDAAANTAYRVEMATDLAKGDWQVLTTFTNTATIGKKVTVTDPAAAQTGQRFYRIRLQP